MNRFPLLAAYWLIVFTVRHLHARVAAGGHLSEAAAFWLFASKDPNADGVSANFARQKKIGNRSHSHTICPSF
jgi:hypothetical protein